MYTDNTLFVPSSYCEIKTSSIWFSGESMLELNTNSKQLASKAVPVFTPKLVS